ncbi:MAG: AMP-binding protein, partial [Gemmatimonadota bacterium]
MTPTLLLRPLEHGPRPAVVAPEGLFTYADLAAASAAVAARLLHGREDMGEARVCFLVPAGWQWVTTAFGVWRAGGLAVPLAVSHPTAELARVLDDADPERVVAHPALADRVAAEAAARGVPVTPPGELTKPGGGAASV